MTRTCDHRTKKAHRLGYFVAAPDEVVKCCQQQVALWAGHDCINMLGVAVEHVVKAVCGAGGLQVQGGGGGAWAGIVSQIMLCSLDFDVLRLGMRCKRVLQELDSRFDHLVKRIFQQEAMLLIEAAVGCSGDLASHMLDGVCMHMTEFTANQLIPQYEGSAFASSVTATTEQQIDI